MSENTNVSAEPRYRIYGPDEEEAKPGLGSKIKAKAKWIGIGIGGLALGGLAATAVHHFGDTDGAEGGTESE